MKFRGTRQPDAAQNCIARNDDAAFVVVDAHAGFQTDGQRVVFDFDLHIRHDVLAGSEGDFCGGVADNDVEGVFHSQNGVGLSGVKHFCHGVACVECAAAKAKQCADGKDDH